MAGKPGIEVDFGWFKDRQRKRKGPIHIGNPLLVMGGKESVVNGKVGRIIVGIVVVRVVAEIEIIVRAGETNGGAEQEGENASECGTHKSP